MFLLSHRHQPDECRFAFAAWNGFSSPLRGHPALASCEQGEHEVWWTVHAPDAASALGQLPPYVEHRTAVRPVGEVTIP